MMMYLKLAWRNIWRNGWRSGITMAMVFLAVYLSSQMMSLKEGMYDRMVDSMVGKYTGYVQIQHPDYWEEQSIDNAMFWTDSLASIRTSHVTGIAPRLQSFALAAAGELSKPAMVMGVDVDTEVAMTGLDERVAEGELIVNDDQQVMLGDGLAEKLELSVGDTIVMLGQGYHGMSAAGKYRVKGIVKYGLPELSNNLVMMPLKEAQWMYAASGVITTAVVHIDNMENAATAGAALQAAIGPDLEVKTWLETNQELVEMIEMDRGEGYVFMFILYGVISFGIFGTVIMMLAERRREFGVLNAIGMKKTKLTWVTYLELEMLTLLGAVAGVLGAMPMALWMHYNPIEIGGEQAEMYEEYGMEAVLQTSVDPMIFITQGLVVAIIASFISVFTVFKLYRLNPVKAMRS